jgi:uncharacterized membrane protein
MFDGGRGAIEKAIDGWLKAGLLDAATAARLREHEANANQPHTGRLTILAFGFGGLLLAAGAFLFVAAHWQDVSPWGRFATLLAMTAALHVGGAFGARFSPSLATALHAVGTAVFGAGIFLSGQVFNLQEQWPEAFLLWAAGAAVAAWLLRDWPQILWVAVLGPAWLVSEWGTRYPWDRVAYTDAAESVVPFGLAVLAAAYVAAPGQDLDSTWRRALARLGAVVLVLSAYGLARLGTWMNVPETGLPPPPDTLLASGWAVAIALPLTVAFLLRRSKAWPVAVVALLAGAVVLLDPSVTWQRLLVYLIYAVGSAGMVAWGMFDRVRLRVNLGVLSFVLTVLAFYFSSLFDMLGRAFGLIGMGLLCIGGGWVAERGRRRLLARLDSGTRP